MAEEILAPPTVGAKTTFEPPAEAGVNEHALSPALGRPSFDGARVRYRAIGVGLAASDALALIAAIIVAYLIRFGWRPMALGYVVLLAVGPVVWVSVFFGWRLHTPRLFAAPEEFRRVIGASSSGMVLVALTSYLTRLALSRLWIVMVWLLALGFEFALRWAWRRLTDRLRDDGRLAVRTLVIGTNDEAVRLAEDLKTPGVGFNPIGYVSAGRDGAVSNGLPVLGPIESLRALIQEHGVDCLFVASTATDIGQMRVAARAGQAEGVEVLVSSRMPDVIATRLVVQPVGRSLALSVRPIRLTRGQAVVKRAFDLIVASAAMIAAAPVWVVASIAIKLDSSGPVLYRQERVGKNGRTFWMYKFRTMVVDADALREKLRNANESDGLLFKIRNDPRITRVGKHLRRWSLDELPQLLNVIRGDMSLVGPRPPLPIEVARYEASHFERLAVAPGITGLWQVSGRSDVSFEEYVRLDLFYIENWSVAYDLFVLLKTIPAVISKQGSY